MQRKNKVHPNHPYIDTLQNGQTVTARWGRWTERDSIGADYNEWQEARLYVQRGGKDNQVCCVSLMDVTWAEYGSLCWAVYKREPNAISFEAEDWFLQIKLPEEFTGKVYEY